MGCHCLLSPGQTNAPGNPAPAPSLVQRLEKATRNQLRECWCPAQATLAAGDLEELLPCWGKAGSAGTTLCACRSWKHHCKPPARVWALCKWTSPTYRLRQFREATKTNRKKKE